MAAGWEVFPTERTFEFPWVFDLQKGLLSRAEAISNALATEIQNEQY